MYILHGMDYIHNGYPVRKSMPNGMQRKQIKGLIKNVYLYQAVSFTCNSIQLTVNV